MSNRQREKRNEYFDREIFPKIKEFCKKNQLHWTEYGVGHFRVFNKEKITVDFWKSGTHGTVRGEYIRFDASGIIPELQILLQASNKASKLEIDHKANLKELTNKINAKKKEKNIESYQFLGNAESHIRNIAKYG